MSERVVHSSEVLLGYEVGTGAKVIIPIRHMVCTGMTQNSGKTTTLEALVARSNVTALAFVTKRGETAFAHGHRVQPYFRDRADWQFVDQLLSAVLNEKNKFLRPWIIKICRSTKTLADVQARVREAGLTAKGINQGVYTQLEAYLDLIVPEIEGADLADSLDLQRGLNVMDVSGFDTPMQMLFVQSAIDWVNAHRRNTVVVVPEAWEFIPEGRGSPVKASAVALVRKGAGLGNFIWVDSQDTAGVDKVILRGCTVWLLGVQREANEIKRNLDNIPAGLAKPKAQDVALLERGQFFACHGRHVLKTYVRPAWASDADAIGAAVTGATVIAAPPPPETKRGKQVNEQEARALRADNQRLKAQVEKLVQEIEALKVHREETQTRRETSLARSTKAVDKLAVHPPATAGEAPPATVNLDAIYAEIMRRISADPVLLRLATEKPAIEVRVTRRVIEATQDSLNGKIALLISEGWFDTPKSANAAMIEWRGRGHSHDPRSMLRACDDLAALGFLRKGSNGYTAVEGMKVNVVES